MYMCCVLCVTRPTAPLFPLTQHTLTHQHNTTQHNTPTRQLEEAAAAYTRALEVNPENPLARHALGALQVTRSV